MEEDEATELVLGLKESPSRPTSLPATGCIMRASFSTTRSEHCWFTSRAALRMRSETPLPAASWARESISASTNGPPKPAPGCRQRGEIFLSRPSAAAKSTASALTCSQREASSLMKEILVATNAVEASRTSSAVS